MELGQVILLGQEAPDNLVVVVIDNGVYESIGSGEKGPRPTATSGTADLAGLARASGVPYAVTVNSLEGFDAELEAAFAESGCRFLNVRTEPGHSRVPPRQRDGFEDKYRFVRYIENTEGIQILHLAQQDRRLMKTPPTPTRATAGFEAACVGVAVEGSGRSTAPMQETAPSGLQGLALLHQFQQPAPVLDGHCVGAAHVHLFPEVDGKLLGAL